MKRHLVKFSVRCRDALHTAALAQRVGDALGCVFEDGKFEQVPSMVANVFGMEVSLQPWEDGGGTRIHRLRGNVLDVRFTQTIDGTTPTFESTDISEYVADLLDVATDQSWYIPTAADLAGEREHGRRMDEAY